MKYVRLACTAICLLTACGEDAPPCNAPQARTCGELRVVQEPNESVKLTIELKAPDRADALFAELDRDMITYDVLLDEGDGFIVVITQRMGSLTICNSEHVASAIESVTLCPTE